MSSLPSLMKRFQVVTREIVERETELAEIQRQIVAAANAPRRRKTSAPVDGRRVSDGIKSVVKVLKEADQPLQRHEIANALGINGSAAGFRLAQAIKLKFVERVLKGRYAVTADVPEL